MVKEEKSDKREEEATLLGPNEEGKV